MKNVLVLCTGNSCRSQMAHGWLNYYSGGTSTIYSAGIETHGVNPKAIHSMAKAGVDISHHTSNHVDEYLAVEFDYIITVCDNAAQSCPVFQGDTPVVHWPFEDPADATRSEDEVIACFRDIRDQISSRIKTFLAAEK